MQRLWMLRGMLALFLAGLIVALLALCIGIVGCYRRSAKLVGWTAMLFLLSGTIHYPLSMSDLHFCSAFPHLRHAPLALRELHGPQSVGRLPLLHGLAKGKTSESKK